MIAVSTAWNSKRQPQIEPMLEEIRALGAAAVELGYNFSESRLSEIVELLPRIPLKVSSVHNYCPLPDDGRLQRHVSNLHRLSATEESERARAVLWTRRSVDTAAKVGASAVVIHAGTVEMDGALEKELFRLYREGRRKTDECHQALAAFHRERARRAPVHLQAIEKSLKEVLSYARTRGIKIGLETRYYPMEIPSMEEVGFLLKKFAHEGLVYWHDTGHAEVNERLGLATHLGYFRGNEQHLYGMHIHGVIGLDDHQAPFTGDFDFGKIGDFLQRDIIKVIESHEEASPQEMKVAIKKLKEGTY